MRHHRVSQALGIVALLFLVSGCGLSTYEAKLDAAQKRVSDFDATESYLGAPVVRPETSAVDFYLRPPRGISRTAEAAPVNGFFYRFPLASASKSGIFELYVGVAADGNVQAVRAQILKMFPTAVALPEKSLDPSGESPILLQVWTGVDVTAKNYVYLYPSGNNVVALAFRVDLQKAGAEAEAAIEASLRTLAVGPAATARRARDK